MLAAKDQIRRHGPFRRLRRALIRQPQRILSRVRRVFVSLAPAIAPSRVRFAARFKKPLARAPEIEITRSRRVVVVAPSSPPSRARPSACVASASRPRRRQSSRRHRVASRSFASPSFVRVRVDRSFARRARSRVRARAGARDERSTRDRSRAHLVERVAASRGRRARSSVSRMPIRVRDSCGCGFYAQTVRR